mmetsp:Transcript_94774/g.272834  ORF Transcript_94774/g.272834 Transcript_94774/m.272834 type:complete len:226 (+) Transcript_94774:755-1432(+)
MTRPTWPRAFLCLASFSAKVRFASPKTAASAIGSISSKRVNLPKADTPGASGIAVAVVLSSSASVPAASLTISSRSFVPSKLVSTCRKSLWLKPRSNLSLSNPSFHRHLKAATESHAEPPGIFRSRISAQCLEKSSAADFQRLDLSGMYEPRMKSSISSVVQVSHTCLTTWSCAKPHFVRSCCVFRFLASSSGESFCFLEALAKSSSSRLSMRFKRNEPSTASFK